ncbi:TonB-dependent receptor domain-containing protein [Maribacter polysaccharolyticus]|uniref:TonB-dependent receptor domain-containing protein n=1 Tax=Maribacter polysaccharolyticus TaxID=3020831 RepID=UPI00237F3F5D|nr:TonB-dependent receptor [Maribacter polysaccharolyticus]MDE3740891.1 TonB-dependent receptor [Maribacter polysaccharolyticus]
MNVKHLMVITCTLLGHAISAQNFKGQVFSQKDHTPVQEVHITLNDKAIGYTDVEGYFHITVPEKGAELTISHLGFHPIKKFITPQEKVDYFYLKEAPLQISGVIVSGDSKLDPVFALETNDYVKKIVQPRNVADLFNGINGFALIKRGNYANDPSFRASQYEQLNVQFDGGTKAMHACPNRMDPITTHVIPEEIDRIEIIKGPYTVRNGATFAGIVNMVAHLPDASDYGLHGSIQSGYESNGGSLVSMARLQQATEKYDVTGNVGFRDFGNYEDGDGTEIPSSFRSLDYGLKVGYNFTPNQRLQAHWRQSFGRDVLHAGLPMDTDLDDSSILSLDYKLSGLNGTLQNIETKLYYSYVDHIMSNTNRPSYMMTHATSEINATTAGGKIEFKLKPSEKSILYTGLDAMYVARDGDRTRIVQSSMTEFEDKIWQDSYINDLGLFVEGKQPLTEHTILTAGLRYDLVTSEIKDPEDDFAAMYPDLDKRNEHNISGTLSLKYVPSNRFTMELAYGRGVRSANMIERVINHFTVGQDSYEYIGNPNLDAEVNNQFEIGFSGRLPFSDQTNDRFNYSSSFYYSFYDHYIVAVIDETLTRKYMPTSEPINPKVFRNLDKAYKTGFEISAGIDFFNDFNFTTELAYVYAKNKDLNESLPLVPPLTTSLKLGYEVERFWVNANYRITSEQDNIAASFGETVTPGYEVMDLRLGIVPLKNLTLGVAALNVFDVTYHNHLNFSFNNQEDFSQIPINDPGRNLSAFVQYRF